ncbi:MAG: MMPL family transporter [Candidatus Tectomicrobia bacterium]|uniref:MMPL family transporter n=1 Tax=Tectimicrobiota bacterium TaxID=2528274 RepID=A0A932GNS0_UNCTE|nr:MMPL family transporter [Candidatus Tectomicrobia bacterium]
MRARWTSFRQGLVQWCADHPRTVLVLVFILTLAFGSQLPRIRTDTDPKNMLPITSPVRQYNDQVEGWFGLHPDVIVVEIQSERGVFTPEILARIARLTDAILRFPGVIARDVVALPTVNDVSIANGVLQARPILDRIPHDAAEAEGLKRQVLDNPLLAGRLVSTDARATAIYIPIEKSANGKAIADRLRQLTGKERGPERYYIAGDPVARDTFGAEMFRQMALFSPLAGMVMCGVLFLMFRSWWVVGANMAVAMIAIIWGMGLFIGLGIPIHIMASMSPVFLMAISTDTVHIFNEFVFRRREVGDRREAIRQTMAAVATPVLFSDLTTIAGFASLAIGPIIPVRVFGLLVAFGTFVILLMSFTLVPALLALAREGRPIPVSREDDLSSSWLGRIGQACVAWKTPVALVGVVLLVISAVGISKIRINNNMVSWFKPGSEIRVADRQLSRDLGGTAMLYLVADGKKSDAVTRPEFLKALEGLQRRIEREPVVGKAVSVADVVKRVHQVLSDNSPSRAMIPDSQEAVAQELLLFSMAARPRDLNNLVDYPHQKANLMVQLRSWNAVETRALLEKVRRDLTATPIPGAEVKPAGIAYFNMVWNDQVLVGMLEGFIASCIFVFFLLILDYRSPRWGVVSFLPLLFTVVLIYGAVGFVRKDFDMPISVLSTLSLGLAIDFAIHFVSRFQQRYRETRDLKGSLVWTAARPGRGIVRNAFLFASGFAVMLFAGLTPYITVGAFMIAIMLLSALATVVYLPALIALFPQWLTQRLKEER